MKSLITALLILYGGTAVAAGGYVYDQNTGGVTIINPSPGGGWNTYNSATGGTGIIRPTPGGGYNMYNSATGSTSIYRPYNSAPNTSTYGNSFGDPFSTNW